MPKLKTGDYVLDELYGFGKIIKIYTECSESIFEVRLLNGSYLTKKNPEIGSGFKKMNPEEYLVYLEQEYITTRGILLSIIEGYDYLKE